MARWAGPAGLRRFSGEIVRTVDEALIEIVNLLRMRNAIDGKITRVINRPVTAGHLGEWIASRIFDIQLEKSAAAQGIDGRFLSGPLAGRTVNVKWYMKRSGLLDTTHYLELDDYLVFTGPRESAVHRAVSLDRGASRPCS